MIFIYLILAWRKEKGLCNNVTQNLWLFRLTMLIFTESIFCLILGYIFTGEFNRYMRADTLVLVHGNDISVISTEIYDQTVQLLARKPRDSSISTEIYDQIVHFLVRKP